MSLVYKHNNIVALRENRKFLALIVTKFLNERKEYAVVFAKHSAETVACFGLAIFLRTHKTAVQEVAVNLTVKVFPVGNDKECEIAGEAVFKQSREIHH